MALFQTLSNTPAFTNNSPTITNTKPAYPPTIVQLYSSTHISFSTNSILDTISPDSNAATNKQPPTAPRKYEVLNYTPLTIESSSSTLGIWSCQCHATPSSRDMAQHVLRSVLFPSAAMAPVYLTVLDLGMPHSVQPLMQSIMTCIANLTDGTKEEEGSFRLQGTTPRSMLQSSTFGQAPSSSTLPPLEEENDQPSSSISLVLCALLPSHTKEEEVTYKDKQALQFLKYHLLKYASVLNCTLVFVRREKEQVGLSSTEGESPVEESKTAESAEEMVGVTVEELAHVLERLTQNVPPVEESSNEEEEGDESSSKNASLQQQQQPSIYGPGQYDVELIDSVYLRNASCPGVWNASEDDLTVALPPPPSSSTSTFETTTNTTTTNKPGDKSLDGTAGDQEWLKRLADSVTSVPGGMMGEDASTVLGGRSVRSGRTSAKESLKSSSSAKKKGGRKVKPASSDNKDVSDFFNDLLTK